MSVLCSLSCPFRIQAPIQAKVRTADFNSQGEPMGVAGSFPTPQAEVAPSAPPQSPAQCGSDGLQGDAPLGFVRDADGVWVTEFDATQKSPKLIALRAAKDAASVRVEAARVAAARAAKEAQAREMLAALAARAAQTVRVEGGPKPVLPTYLTGRGAPTSQAQRSLVAAFSHTGADACNGDSEDRDTSYPTGGSSCAACAPNTAIPLPPLLHTTSCVNAMAYPPCAVPACRSDPGCYPSSRQQETTQMSDVTVLQAVAMLREEMLQEVSQLRRELRDLRAAHQAAHQAAHGAVQEAATEAAAEVWPHDDAASEAAVTEVEPSRVQAVPPLDARAELAPPASGDQVTINVESADNREDSHGVLGGVDEVDVGKGVLGLEGKDAGRASIHAVNEFGETPQETRSREAEEAEELRMIDELLERQSRSSPSPSEGGNQRSGAPRRLEAGRSGETHGATTGTNANTLSEDVSRFREAKARAQRILVRR